MSKETPSAERELGFEEGARCNRMGCLGEIAIYPVENCSCHISPPCGACTSPRAYCKACDWQEKDDKPFNDFIVNENPKTGVWRTWTPRPLDRSKVDWRSLPHTNSTMIKEGCYPEGMSKLEVESLVVGTFGGRFEKFANGEFRYVAYTD